jgi:hypothetical protein
MRNQSQIFMLMVYAVFLSACHPPKGDAGVNAAADSLVLERVSYNHPGLEVELAVGLWAWPLPMDFDSDGDMDLLVSCYDVPFNGLYLFENPSGPGEPDPVFKPPVRIGEGKKNLQVSYVDGYARLLERGTEYVNFSTDIYKHPEELYPSMKLEEKHGTVRFSQWKLVDYDADGDMDIIAGLDDWADYGWDNAFDEHGGWTNGPLHAHVYWLENTGGKFRERGRILAGGDPLDVYGLPSPNMYDFDGDGDLDLICGEFLDGFTWFENTGTRQAPVFAAGRKLRNEGGPIHMHLQMIVPVGVDWDSDGDVDLVVGEEDGRVSWLENTGRVLDHMPLFRDPVYFRQQAGYVKFGALVTPFSVDWDKDGDEDLICGNTAGNIAFIENLGPAKKAGRNPGDDHPVGNRLPRWNPPVLLAAGGETIRIMAGESGSIQGPAEAKWGYTTLSVADWNQDGLLDIIANSIWGKVIWYKNHGTSRHPLLEPARPVLIAGGDSTLKPAWNWWDPEPGNLVTQWRTTPFAVDWNQDGLTDLVMLDQEGYLSLYQRFIQDGKPVLAQGRRIFYMEKTSGYNARHTATVEEGGLLRLNTEPYGGSGRRKICLADWDGDGDLDILVNSINVTLLENTGVRDGMVILEDRGPLAGMKLAGHTTSPTVADWNGNGIPDLLVGAEDGFIYFASR